MKAYGAISETTLRRARAWAAFFGIILLETGLNDHPEHAAMGAAILRRLRDERGLAARLAAAGYARYRECGSAAAIGRDLLRNLEVRCDG